MRPIVWALALLTVAWAQEEDSEQRPSLPDLKGLELEDARSRSPFPIKVVYLASQGAPNLVLYTSPGSGAPYPAGQVVTVYVSQKPTHQIPSPTAPEAATPEGWGGPWLLVYMAVIFLWYGLGRWLLSQRQSQLRPGFISIKAASAPSRSSSRGVDSSRKGRAG